MLYFFLGMSARCHEPFINGKALTLSPEDLKRQNAVLQAAQDDLGQLRTQLWEAQAEVENIKAIATVSENTKQEAIDEVKRQWREEVASLQAVMKGKDRECSICAVIS